MLRQPGHALRLTSQHRASKRAFPRVELLEARLAPAVGTSFVNDNWNIVTDNGDPGLSAGDVVNNANDTIDPGTIVAVFGTDAFSSINNAIGETVDGGTVRVLEGDYTEDVVLDKDVTVRSVGGRALTTLSPATNTALGTVLIDGVTTGATFGGFGQGFTINGIDNPSPSIESAALYIRGTHSNTLIRDNEFVAAGDSGLTAEFAATIDNLLIDSNIFSGKTFAGNNPAGEGFGQQFDLPNVPRQLVVIGGGAGGGNTSNVTFSNNLVNGIAGGLNASGQEQGNTLVTIDSVGADFIGNTFAGTTTRFGSSLRTRGSDVTINGNTFDSTNLSLNNLQLFAPAGVLASGDLQDVVDNNNFDRGVYTVDGDAIGFNIQGFIDAVAPGATLNVLPGNYTGNVDINKALTLSGSFTLDGVLASTDPAAIIQGGVQAQGLDLVDGTTVQLTINSLADFEQFDIDGEVSFEGANLELTFGFVPPPGASFRLVDNDNADDIEGVFDSLDEGIVFEQNGRNFIISYQGGTNNDLVLTSLAPPSLAPQIFAAGTSGGTLATVSVFNAQTNDELFSLNPFEGYFGGIRVSTLDINADGIFDIAVSTAGGVQGHVKVFDGQTGDELRSFFPFVGFAGSVSVGGGDINGDGLAEIIVGAGPGAPGGHVKIFDGQTNNEIRSFFAYDANFLGGVNVDAADITSDGHADIFVAMQSLGSTVRVFDGQDNSLLQSFSTFEGFFGGIFVAAGDTNGDQIADIIVGAGPGAPGGHIKVFDGGDNSILQSFFAYDANFLGGSRVGVDDFDGDGLADLISGPGPGGNSNVRRFDGVTTAQLDSFFAFDVFTDGVFIG